jgi:hypothetical protein
VNLMREGGNEGKDSRVDAIVKESRLRIDK